MESDQYSGQGTYATEGTQSQSSGYYQAEFGVTLTPIGSSSAGQPGTIEQMPVTHSNVTSLSDSSSDSLNITPSKKALTRAELMDRLKRKLPQQCKPSKKPRNSVRQNTDDASPKEDINFFGSVVSAPYVLFENMGTTADSGGHQMLVQVDNRPMFSQLKKNIELKVKDPALMMPKAVQNNPASPLGPMTPDSVVSDYGSSSTNVGTTMLTIDTSGLTTIPESILTPEASPASSPHHAVAADDLKEQCVPSLLLELETMLKEKEEIHSQVVEKKPVEIKKSLPLKPSAQQLPELDALTIDSFFGKLESISKDLNLTVPENESHEAWPVMESESNPAIASCDSSPVPSPENNEETHALNEYELANIVAAAADSIMEMVQLQNDMQTHLMADFAVIPSALQNDVMGDASDDQGFAEVPEVKVEAEEEPLVLSQQDLMNELHQLNQLATNSAPSYGK